MKTIYKLLLLVLILAGAHHSGFAQEDYIDTNIIQADTTETERRKPNLKPLIIPAALITYGIIETAMPEKVRLLNYAIGHEVQTHKPDKFTIDDATQYVPMASVYALNLVGIKGRNNFRDRTIILGMSAAFMGVTVNAVKYSVGKERPDRSGRNSFPSGHTAMAFMGAEFLWQEYRDVSIWYGIAGYTVAAGTGLFRMYNNKHWFGDVAAGAGIGILSTKLAYWLYPSVQRWLNIGDNNTKRNRGDMSFLPYYNGSQVGLSFGLRL